MKKITLLIFLGLIFISSLPLWSKVGTSSGQFLKIGIGARAAGLGDAYCALSDGVETIYWNPAGLADMNRSELSLMYNSWLETINYNFIAFAYPYFSYGTLAVAINYLSMSPITKCDNTGDSSGWGTISPYDLAINFGYGYFFSPKNKIGINLKFINSCLEEDSVTAFAVDLGYQRELTKYFTLGVALQNLGTGLRYREETASLPVNFKFGLAYNRTILTNFSLLPTTFVLDFNLPVDNDLSINSGIEYRYRIIQKMFVAFRFGIKTSHIFSTESYADFGYTHYLGTEYWGAFSFGLGITNENFSLDYAFVPFYDLGSSHRLSLRLKFGKVTSKFLPKGLFR